MERGITVAVLGSGAEACEFARSRAHVGHLVRLYAGSGGAEEAEGRLRDAAELLPPDEGRRLLDAILVTTDLEEALTGAAVVIDARPR
jgi:hypothetical protein